MYYFFSEYGGHVSSEVSLGYIQASLIPHEVNKFRKSYIRRQLMANYRMLANARRGHTKYTYYEQSYKLF